MQQQQKREEKKKKRFQVQVYFTGKRELETG